MMRPASITKTPASDCTGRLMSTRLRSIPHPVSHQLPVAINEVGRQIAISARLRKCCSWWPLSSRFGYFVFTAMFCPRLAPAVRVPAAFYGAGGVLAAALLAELFIPIRRRRAGWKEVVDFLHS